MTEAQRPKAPFARMHAVWFALFAAVFVGLGIVVGFWARSHAQQGGTSAWIALGIGVAGACLLNAALYLRDRRRLASGAWERAKDPNLTLYAFAGGAGAVVFELVGLLPDAIAAGAFGFFAGMMISAAAALVGLRRAFRRRYGLA